MTTVASVDYPNKRIYLSAATVGVPLDMLDVYRDVRALRRVTEAHRAYRPMIVAGGNIQKTPTTYTAPYVQLLYGCYIVPYNTPHSLLVIRDTFSDDGRAGVACFDRSSVSAEVDIDFAVDKVEVRTVNTAGGSGPTADSIAAAVWQRAIESGMSGEQMLRIMFSALAGVTSGIGTGTEQYLAMDGITPRIEATFDQDNNRTSIALDGS